MASFWLSLGQAYKASLRGNQPSIFNSGGPAIHNFYPFTLLGPVFLRKPGQRDIAFGTLLILFGNAQIFGAIHNLIDRAELGAMAPFAVTALWASISLGILIFGMKSQTESARKAGMISLFVCAAKGLLVDVSTAGPVVRIICLLFLGIALFAGGFLLRRPVSKT